MTWNFTGTNRGTKHNKRVRGRGTWGEQTTRLAGHQQARYSREMGRGTWSERGHRLHRAERRRLREQRDRQRRTAQRMYGTAVAAGALVLGAVLAMSGVTRGTGLMMLVLAGLVLYLMIGRKRS